ncbi:MAG TPA: hypothetical protein VNE58_16875 [Casimicrobiaceae bacterium]|nr:hypothetical protein [Casimicrobiaceae bacterium]
MRLRGRPNLFQSAMLRWRELHPYCASHVMVVPAALDEDRLRASIGRVLEVCGLTGLALDADHRRYAFEGGPARVLLDRVEGNGAPFDRAARKIEATINIAFPATGRFDPFRFFFVPATDHFLFGVTYDHFVAGGDSIAVLVTDIADHYIDETLLPTGLELHPPPYLHLFARNIGALVSGLRWFPELVAGWRRAIRPYLRDPADGTNGFAHFEISRDRLIRVRSAAHAWQVTTNDVMLALVLRAVAPLASQRHPTGRRTQVALASIVNLRRDFQPPATRAFGQFLSSFRVVHPLPSDESLETVARSLAVQTARARRLKLYLVTLLAIAASAILWRFTAHERRHRLYIKYHPVFAGLTPLNVDALRRRPSSREGGYLRAASTGPMAPMVVATTTSGQSLRVGITFRTTALSRSDVEAVIASIERDMDSLS